MSGPILNTPFTRMTEHWLTQQTGRCAPYEMDFYECASRVGEAQAKVDCRKQMEDLMECLFQRKQYQRYAAMHRERQKQKRPYLESPPADCVYLNYGR